MDKIHQVFVSSIYEDFKEDRRHVLDAVLRSNCIPVGMEFSVQIQTTHGRS